MTYPLRGSARLAAEDLFRDVGELMKEEFRYDTAGPPTMRRFDRFERLLDKYGFERKA